MPEMSPHDILPRHARFREARRASLWYESARSEVARPLTLVITTLASFHRIPNTVHTPQPSNNHHRVTSQKQQHENELVLPTRRISKDTARDPCAHFLCSGRDEVYVR